MKTPEERKAILENEVAKQLRKGWRISSKTETGCQLLIDKKRDTVTVVVLFLFFILPGIFYLLLTMGRTQSVYIEVTEDGEIRYSSKDFSAGMLKQASELANKDLKK
jgi:hypothetical protein